MDNRKSNDDASKEAVSLLWARYAAELADVRRELAGHEEAVAIKYDTLRRRKAKLVPLVG